MEKQITVTKVALSMGMFMTVSYKEHLPGNDERTHPNVKCLAPVHIDLTNAFALFTPHLARIGEEITNEQFIEAMPNDVDATEGVIVELGEVVPAIKASRSKKVKGTQEEPYIFPEDEVDEDESKLMDKFELSSIEFTYKNGIEGIILVGSKQLSTLKWIGVGPTPVVKINDTDYPYVSDLFQLGELIKYEISEYIINHKYAPAKDPELPFGDGISIADEQY